MAENIYHKTISNEYLGITEEIKGTYPAEVRIKAETQLARWAGREKRQRERDEIQSLSALAEYDSRQAGEFRQECQNILRANLNAKGKLDWASFYDDRPYPPFVFKEPAPRYDQIAGKMGVPEKSFLAELFFPSVKKRRLNLENQAKAAYDDQLRQYEERKEAARIAHEEQRAAYIEEQAEYNRSVDQLQFDFERGLPGGIESSTRIALAGLTYPDSFELEFDAQYDQAEKLIIVNCVLPAPEEVPRTVRCIYNEEEHGITPVEMDQEEFNDFYSSLLLQVALGSIRVIFDSVPARHVQQVAFNGLVKRAAPETDRELMICILTCKVSRNLFDSLDLAAVSPEECFSGLGGLMAPPLTELTPVQPMASIKRTPPLFSETGQISRPKPKVYEPGDFKHAAKELIADMLDQMEKDLLGLSRPPKGSVH